MTTPPRVDSSNLVGLLNQLGVIWHPPTVLPIAVGLGLGFLAALKAKTTSAVMCALALALGGSFFVSSQAFANYWLMVMGLSLLGLATLDGDQEPPNDRHSLA